MSSILLDPRTPRPRLLGSLVQLHDEGDPRRSDVTLLAASLLTLGIVPADKEYFCASYQFDGRGATVWRSFWSFRDESRCRRFDTRKMIAAWTDGQWLLQNPTHPLSILRGGLTYKAAFQLTPRFSKEDLTCIETPDTWLEAGARNLVMILRDMPEAIQKAARNLLWFGRTHAAAPPKCMPESDKTRFLKYVEHPAKRPDYRAA